VLKGFVIGTALATAMAARVRRRSLSNGLGPARARRLSVEARHRLARNFFGRRREAPFALARGHIVFRLDHSNQKSGRLMPQNLAAEECCGGGHKSQGAATPTLTGNAS
jgi:hypothetical protein